MYHGCHSMRNEVTVGSIFGKEPPIDLERLAPSNSSGPITGVELQPLFQRSCFWCRVTQQRERRENRRSRSGRRQEPDGPLGFADKFVLCRGLSPLPLAIRAACWPDGVHPRRPVIVRIEQIPAKFFDLVVDHGVALRASSSRHVTVKQLHDTSADADERCSIM